jgi:hypothetical protein
MSVKIRFEVMGHGLDAPQPLHEMEAVDDADFLEKQVLIGLALELEGRSYEVVNQVIEPTAEGGIVYYVQEVLL